MDDAYDVDEIWAGIQAANARGVKARQLFAPNSVRACVEWLKYENRQMQQNVESLYRWKKEDMAESGSADSYYDEEIQVLKEQIRENKDRIKEYNRMIASGQYSLPDEETDDI